jgi:hypothetical protein
MATNLTNSTIASTYSQLLHVDGGPEATEKVVHSGTGVATAMRVGTQSVSVNNLRVSGNSVTSTNANGDINITPSGTGVVVISRANIQAGTVVSDDVTITGGTVSNVAFTGTFTGITSIESDEFRTVNGNPEGLIISTNEIVSDGVAADVDIEITPKGAGQVVVPDLRASGSLGYTTSAFGTVTQTTSKSTAVTLNKVTGRITMHNAALNRNSGVSFVLNNSFVAATDVVIVNIASGATVNIYTATIDAVGAGVCTIHLHNHSTGTDLSEPVELLFAIIKVG